MKALGVRQTGYIRRGVMTFRAWLFEVAYHFGGNIYNKTAKKKKDFKAFENEHLPVNLLSRIVTSFS